MIGYYNDTTTTEIYTLALHDALPICGLRERSQKAQAEVAGDAEDRGVEIPLRTVDAIEERRKLELSDDHVEPRGRESRRSDEHTSELQSRQYLVCRLLLEKKKYFSLH